MIDQASSALAAKHASLEGCRKLAGHIMPGHRPAIFPRPGGPLEPSPENITRPLKNTGFDHQPNSLLTTCQSNSSVIFTHRPAIQYLIQSGCITPSPTTTIHLNIGKYSDFGTPGGPPPSHRLKPRARCLNPLSHNAFLNSKLKIKPSNLPHFTPKKARFFVSLVFGGTGSEHG
jgi:hypothetical protein